METKEAIKAVIEQDGLGSAVEWIANVVDEKHGRIEKLEAALREIDEWAEEHCMVGLRKLIRKALDAK